MLESFAKRLFGSANDRFLSKLSPDVQAINALEPSLKTLSDADLAARTSWFKERLANGDTLDDIMIDAFATVREAAKRVLDEANEGKMRSIIRRRAAHVAKKVFFSSSPCCQ